MLARRSLIGGGLAGGALLTLPGCATTMASTPHGPAKPCLPPVIASQDRIIRTVAGLRPYRASGFVVRAEALGDKRLVHNYGHGGAGITLSWGTSRLATLAGLPGHSGSVAVIGAGVMGLTTARLVQEAGFDVTLYTEALPPDTTSNIAGGQWHPFGHYADDSVTPEWRNQYRAARDYSWRRFQIMVGDDYGIHWLTTYSEGEVREADHHPARQKLEVGEHPFPVEAAVWRYDTMYVETGRFLRELAEDIQIAGCRFVIRKFGSPADISTLPEKLVFNCTGLGSHALFGDTELSPIRGQLAIILPQPEINYAYTGDMGYMFPRADGIVLGGTFERGQWDATPQPDRIERIVASHQRFFGAMTCPA